MAIHYRHDFHAFSTLGWTDFRASALGHRKGRVDELSSSSSTPLSRSSLATSVRTSTQNFAVAPRLKPTMHGFVVRIALRQHVPLRASVENPQDCFEHAPRRNRFASGPTIGNVFLRKMIPNALPMLVAEPNHPNIYSRSSSLNNFEIAF